MKRHNEGPIPPRPLAFSVVVESFRLALSSPAALVLVMIAVLVPSTAVWLLGPSPVPTMPALPLEKAPVPLQEWTTDAQAVGMVAAFVHGALPAPLPGQITTKSRCKWPHQIRNGGCWVPVDVKPCKPPDGDGTPLYEDDSRCWAPVLKAEKQPTTGEPRTPTVADP